MKPFPIFYSLSFVFRYRLWSIIWWSELLEFIRRGWLEDLKTLWYRARYGWAPRDVWNLDHYLASVLAGSLKHLIYSGHSAPMGYPIKGPVSYHAPTDFGKWSTDLLKWSDAFREYVECDDVVWKPPFWTENGDYSKMEAEEKRRSENLHTALREMEPWFESLWD